MRKRTPNTYGFTTTPKDFNFLRIAREAKPDQRFIFTHIKNTQTGRDFLGLLIRKDSLPKKVEGLKLLGKPLAKTTFGKPAGAYRYAIIVGKGISIAKVANKVKDDLRKLQNHLDNRVIRVLVEAL